jgi:hypothetical protein
MQYSTQWYKSTRILFNNVTNCYRAGYEPFQAEGTAESGGGVGNTERASAVEGSTEEERPTAGNLSDIAATAVPSKTNPLFGPSGPESAPPRGQRPGNQRPFPPPLPPRPPPSNAGSLDPPQRPEFVGPEQQPPPASSTLSLLEQIFGTTTPQTVVDIQPSFEPPVLVTPPPPQRRPFIQRPRPPAQRRPGPPPPQGRPPQPLLLPVPPQQQPLPPSAFPTPPLESAVRPLVFPTRPAINAEPTEFISAGGDNGGLFREPEVVTGFAIPADNDVFDLTVTANQNFGGSASRPTKKYNGKFFHYIMRTLQGVFDEDDG